MALSYALHHIESNKLAELTNYGQFLERHTPDHFVEIIEDTSWSCVHGVERWRSNCGCNSGGRPGWNQEWRAPLKAALDWLRDCLAPIYEQQARPLLKDPWLARDEYIQVIFDRSPESVARFLQAHATHPLTPDEEVAALKLLEMQRHAMLMYTSCGWFFDEVSGLETVQVLQYAGRAIQLGQDFVGDTIEAAFLDHLAAAKSNVPEHGDGRQIYEKWVKPAFVSIQKVAGHYAISSLFEPYGERTGIFCYSVERQDYSLDVEGRQRLATGRARFSSDITHESATLNFGVLHLGDHNVTGGVRPFENIEYYEGLKARLTEAFTKADLTEVIRTLTDEFPENSFSLRTLFRDEQRKIVNLILNDSLATAAAAYRGIYENQAPLIRFLSALGIPVPAAFRSAAEIALNNLLKQAFEKPELDPEGIHSHLREASVSNVTLDVTGLEYTIRQRLEREANHFAKDPTNLESVHNLRRLLAFVTSLPFPVGIWEVQNICYSPLMKAIEDLRLAAAQDNPIAKNTLDELLLLRDQLRIKGD
jgi:hypothetical protein